MQRSISSTKNVYRHLLHSHRPPISDTVIPHQPPCDVFINHRGIDTKKNVAGLLYDHLWRLNLRPFLDSKNMKPGDKLFDKIDTAIAGCKVGVAVFSPRYCQSIFCLQELARIMEAKKKVIPIFCDVKPSQLIVKDRWRTPKHELDRFKSALEEAKYTVGLTFDSSNGKSDAVMSGVLTEDADEVPVEYDIWYLTIYYLEVTITVTSVYLYCPLKQKEPLLEIDPEIEKTFRKRRRGKKQSQPSVEPVVVSTVIMAELPLPPPVQTTVHIADDKDRKIRDYATPGADQFASGIPRPDANNRFELKPVMFQMLQTMGQFGGSTVEDPHAHLKSFLEVADSFHIPGVAEDVVRLRLFPFTLRDRAKAWINSFRPNSLITWNVLAEKFLQKYFPPTRNVKLRNEIILFRQGEDETLSEAWERFKELLR
ncbi:hypothetical protein OSB04_008291 [Centaurea solstitialis]|uniref:TIR domain-containing protein n=1 Tax=Centaurea solstitialis TaxID=347529 RepID=A0AA38TZ90_9ASTR|nr:hypothetical protein OSB04_008291 [Centaurea solstitialis]